MKIFSVFEPPARRGESAPADRFAFVRDGFSWGAFLFGPLWLLWHRLWLAFVGYVLLVGALAAASSLIGVSPGGRVFVAALIALLLGFEGTSLRRWTLSRRGWRDLGIVVAYDLEGAERRFFEAWGHGPPAGVNRGGPSSRAPAIQAGATRTSGIVGLFPEPGAGR